MIERCIRDREGRIVGYLAGYSNAELQSLLRRHASEGWHVSYAKYTENGLVFVLPKFFHSISIRQIPEERRKIKTV